MPLGLGGPHNVPDDVATAHRPRSRRERLQWAGQRAGRSRADVRRDRRVIAARRRVGRQPSRGGRSAPVAPGPASVDPPPAGPGVDPGSLDDAALIAGSRVDPELFGTLYDRYCDQIYGYVYRRLNDREAAEDVTAEVFVKALRAVDGYRPAAGPFVAWLYGIARNAVIDHLRARRSTVSLDHAADAADRAAPVDVQAIDRVEAAKVWEAIERLTDAQRIAVTLRLGQDLPIAAIAQHLGRTEGAVKLLLNRGLAAVRLQLEGVAGGEEAQV